VSSKVANFKVAKVSDQEKKIEKSANLSKCTDLIFELRKILIFIKKGNLGQIENINTTQKR
jgi:predicted nucleotidyltransferase|tara:strand:+ start:216 stop:398 length:183 start_codon:yes stop_codon:yes gene_type:complete